MIWFLIQRDGWGDAVSPGRHRCHECLHLILCPWKASTKWPEAERSKNAVQVPGGCAAPSLPSRGGSQDPPGAQGPALRACRGGGLMANLPKCQLAV